MFTIRQHLGITRSEVKWDLNFTECRDDPESLKAQKIQELLDQAKARLTQAPTSYTEEVTLRREVNGSSFFGETVKSLLDKVIKLNQDESMRIKKLIEEARNSDKWKSRPNKDILDELQASFDKDFKRVENKIIVDKANVIDTSKTTQDFVRSAVVTQKVQVEELKKILEGNGSP